MEDYHTLLHKLNMVVNGVFVFRLEELSIQLINELLACKVRLDFGCKDHFPQCFLGQRRGGYSVLCDIYSIWSWERIIDGRNPKVKLFPAKLCGTLIFFCLITSL